MKKNIVSVIITFNSIKWIEKVINSLRKSSSSTDIVIIDNGSIDGTIDFIENNHPSIILIKSKENLGFSKANNLGIEIATKNNADFVFLLNHDAWVQDDTLYKLTKTAINHPEFGILSPIHLNGKGDKLDYRFAHYCGPMNCPNLMNDKYLDSNLKEIYQTSFVNAAAWLITKECIKKVGGFNPLFMMYGEDDNYVHRLIYHGFKIGIVPHCNIYHDRENRSRGIYGSEFYKFKNRILKEYSNPQKNIIIRQEYIALFKEAFICIIRFKLSRIRVIVKKLFFLSEVQTKIKKNKEISMRDQNAFLHIKNI